MTGRVILVGAGSEESAAHPEHPLAGLYRSHACVAGRQHGPLDSGQIERRDLLRREDPVLAVLPSRRREHHTRHRRWRPAAR